MTTNVKVFNNGPDKVKVTAISRPDGKETQLSYIIEPKQEQDFLYVHSGQDLKIEEIQ